jgi:hypothetical protein
MIPEDIVKQIPAEEEAKERWLKNNFKRVAISVKLGLNDVASDEPLRRFIDLPKLFDLLTKKRLVLPRLRQLMEGDPFECFARQSFDHLSRPELERYAKQLEYLAPDSAKGLDYSPGIANAWARIGKGQPRFDNQIQRLSLEELRSAVSYLERERLKHDLVCSCWYKGTGESDAMWKIYAAQLGVSITSSAAQMEAAMKLMVPRIYAKRIELKLGAVDYGDTNQCGDRKPWLIKREAFGHENEVRLYCDVPFAFGEQFEIEVDLAHFISEIVITPFCATWQVSGIKAAIEALLKDVRADIKVRQSKHMQAPEIVWPPDLKAHEGSIAEALARVGLVSSFSNPKK